MAIPMLDLIAAVEEYEARIAETRATFSRLKTEAPITSALADKARATWLESHWAEIIVLGHINRNI